MKTETLELKHENVSLAYKEGTKDEKKFLERLFGKNVFAPIDFKQITSFEQACEIIGEDPEQVLPYKNPTTARQKATNDRTILDVIAQAIQGNDKVDYADSNQYKWQAYFDYKTNKAAFVFAYSLYYSSYAIAGAGSRFVFLSSAKSDHFGKQFIEIHNRLLTNNY